MRVILLNGIMWTAERGVIGKRRSIRDCMICTLARGFVRTGHEVTLVTAADYRPTAAEDLGFDVVYLPSRCKGVFNPAYLPWMPALRDYLRREIDRTDVVITSEAFSLMTLQAAGIAGEKLVVWQEMYMHQRKFFTLASRLWHNVAVRFFMRRALFVPRSERARAFISHYARRVATTWVDHGADSERFFPSDEVDKSFVVVSQLVPRKRIDKIIEAFASLVERERYADYRLDIAGSGPQEAELRNIAEQSGITASVTFHGHLEHDAMAAVLRRATALLIYTEKDLNMVSIPEAIVSGTPIVTNSLPANSSHLMSSGMGIVDDRWDADTLAEMIENNAACRAACRANRDRFTAEGVARALLAAAVCR